MHGALEPPGAGRAAQPIPDQARLVLRSRGMFAVLDAGGGDLTPRSRKGRALLVYLAAHPGEKLPRERLSTLLWSDRGEEQARHSLRQCLHELRRIEPVHRALRDAPTWIALDEGAIRWDADQVGQAVREGAPDTLLQWLRRDGHILGGLDGIDTEFDDWLRGERERRLRELRALVVTAAEAALARGQIAVARDLCTCFADHEPTDEAAAIVGMMADARAGDVAALRRRYRGLEAALLAELDAPVAPETSALFEHLVAMPAASRVTARSPPAQMANAAVAAIPQSPQPRVTANRTRRNLALIALLLLAASGALWALWRPGVRPPAAGPTLIAVLPFAPLTRGDGLLADGLWEDTRAAIARNPEFRVLGRTTATELAGRGLAPRWYRDNLGVAYLLDGTVRRAGERVRVSVSLVRTDDGISVWDSSLDGRIGDGLALQYAIAREIEGRIRGRLAPGGGARPEQISTSPEVYALFTEARILLRARETAAAQRATVLLERAVAQDPNFAPAWASLGLALRFGNFGPAGGADRQAASAAHVRRALALAPNLAQAHAALAMIEGEGSPTAEASLERAVALDPGHAEAWLWLGNNRAQQYRRREAAAAYLRAVEIDPLLPPALVNSARLFTDLEDAAAIDRLAARAERAGGRELQIWIRAEAALERGDHSAALASLLALRRGGAGRWGGSADDALLIGLTGLGYFDEAARLAGLPDWFSPVMHARAMPPMRLDRTAIGPRDFWLHPYFAAFASRAMLARRRGDEVVELYRRGFESRDDAVATLQRAGTLVPLAPTIAVALRASGNEGDAEYLLAAAERQVRARLANAPGHRHLLWELGLVRAAGGQGDEGVRLIEQAVARGWFPDGRLYALDIVHEPSLSAFTNDRRFHQVRRRVLARIDRERAELGLSK